VPLNIELVGFLRDGDNVRAMPGADIPVLRTEPRSVVRAGYEAGYACRPLVVSDWPVLRDVFPYAMHVQNKPHVIAEGVCGAVERRRWDCQHRTLHATLALPSTEAPVALEPEL
jgi:hypothetical protein